MLPFQPPIDPMLAKIEEEIPAGEGWRFEPKWDGFRAIVSIDGDEIHIWSRDRRPLERYFPELPPLLANSLPNGSIVDGEIVIEGPHGLDFDALQLRLHPAASRAAKLSKEIPASMVVFDLLAAAGEDLRGRTLDERRAALERAVPSAEAIWGGTATGAGGSSRLLLTPQTDDREVALAWFHDLESAGLDGVIAKRADGPYVPGERVMRKVKHRRTADCVVGGYRVAKGGDGVGSLLLGLYDADGMLHYVGHTSSFKAAERPLLLEQLQPLVGGESFGGGRMPGGPSRWNAGKDPSFVPLEPRLVCEVRYDKLQQGRFRHATTFLRWRDDRDPASCTYDQLGAPAENEERGNP